MIEFELLYRSTLDSSMTSKERDRFKTRLTVLPSFKPFSDNCKFENNLSAEELNSLNLSWEIKTW